MQQQLGAVERELISIDSDLRRLSTQRQLRGDEQKALADAKIPKELIDETLSKEPTVHKHLEDIARLKNLIDQYRAKSVRPEGNDPTLQKHVASLLAEQKALKEARERLTPEVTEKVRLLRTAETAKSIHDLEQQIVMHQANQKQLSEQSEELRGRLQNMTKDGNRLDVDRDELTQLEWFTKLIADQELQLRVEIRQASDPAEVIEATVILRAAEHSPLLLVTIGS